MTLTATDYTIRAAIIDTMNTPGPYTRRLLVCEAARKAGVKIEAAGRAFDSLVNEGLLERVVRGSLNWVYYVRPSTVTVYGLEFDLALPANTCAYCECSHSEAASEDAVIVILDDIDEDGNETLVAACTQCVDLDPNQYDSYSDAYTRRAESGFAQ